MGVSLIKADFGQSEVIEADLINADPTRASCAAATMNMAEMSSVG